MAPIIRAEINLASRTLGTVGALVNRIRSGVFAAPSIALAQACARQDINVGIERSGLFVPNGDDKISVYGSAAAGSMLSRAGVSNLFLGADSAPVDIHRTMYTLATRNPIFAQRALSGIADIGIEVSEGVKMPFTWGEYYRDIAHSNLGLMFSPLSLRRNYGLLSDYLHSQTPELASLVISSTAHNSGSLCARYLSAAGESSATVIMHTLFRQGVVGQHPFEAVYKGNMLELASDTLLSPSTVAHIISRYLPKEGYMESICEDILANGGISKWPTGETVWVAYDPPKYSERNLIEAAQIIGLHSSPEDILIAIFNLNKPLALGIYPLASSDPAQIASTINAVAPKEPAGTGEDNKVYDHDGWHWELPPDFLVYKESSLAIGRSILSSHPMEIAMEALQHLRNTNPELADLLAGRDYLSPPE